MKSISIVALALLLATTGATIPPAYARGAGGGGGNGGGMGANAAGGMPANSNAGGAATGLARVAEVSGNGALGSSSADSQPSTVTPSQSTNGRLAAALGALNASHASASAFSHASSKSRVGKIAAYRSAMLAALALPADSPTDVAAQSAAIASARALLAAAANKPLNANVVSTVDAHLGLPASDPTVGLSQ